jgi:hypothetical protein
MMDDSAHDRIDKEVKKKKGFLTHLSVYVAMAIFFLAMNIATFSEGREWWFFFPLIPWGVGILIHYFTVFGLPGTQKLIEKWEIEETVREMRKMRESGQDELPSGEVADDQLELPNLRKEKNPQYNDDEFV